MHDVRAQEGRILLEVLDALKQGALGSPSITVRILAAADHDGVCSARILQTLLQRAGAKYSIIPVTGNTEIINHLNQLQEDVEVRSLVLLNCGASLNLQLLLRESGASPELKCFVLDAHRPMARSNLSSSHGQVIVLDDDPILEREPGLRPPVDDDDDSGESVGEAEESSGDEKENVFGGQSSQETGVSKRRQRQRDKQESQARKRQRLHEYYMNSYYATPTAVSLFKMAKQAAPPSQDLLWLAAVSLIGYYDLGLVSDVEYGRMAWDDLKEALDRAGELPDAESMASQNSDDEHSQHSAPRMSTRTVRRQRLRFETELRLTLYKHWTLEESMLHSSYFYGAMGLDRDKGLRAQKNFFATAGIPPNDFRQLYVCMDLRTRKSLQRKFREHGKPYALREDHMFLQQFVRELGTLGESNSALHLGELSSADAAQIVTALLSLVPPALSSTSAIQSSGDGRRDAEAINELERQVMVDNFWAAFNAVLCKDPGPLRTGIEEATKVAKAVQSLARFIIGDHDGLGSSKHFQWCKVEQPPPIFRHHLTVRRLAVWLLHILFTYRSHSGVERPLLVMVRDHVRDSYLCVGASPPRSSDQNEFGHRFRSVLRAEKGLEVRYDFFDKSCIEVASDDFDRFWRTLVDLPA